QLTGDGAAAVHPVRPAGLTTRAGHADGQEYPDCPPPPRQEKLRHLPTPWRLRPSVSQTRVHDGRHRDSVASSAVLSDLLPVGVDSHLTTVPRLTLMRTRGERGRRPLFCATTGG